jgi:hypothetical protein
VTGEASQLVKLCVHCGAALVDKNKRADFCSKKCYSRRQTAKYANVPRELGIKQRAMLKALRAHDGAWHEGCGWSWDSPSVMKQLLKTLIRHGLVAIESGTSPPIYRLVEQRAIKCTGSST